MDLDLGQSSLQGTGTGDSFHIRITESFLSMEQNIISTKLHMFEKLQNFVEKN